MGLEPACFGATIRRTLFLGVARNSRICLPKPISLLKVARCFRVLRSECYQQWCHLPPICTADTSLILRSSQARDSEIGRMPLRPPRCRRRPQLASSLGLCATPPPTPLLPRAGSARMSQSRLHVRALGGGLGNPYGFAQKASPAPHKRIARTTSAFASAVPARPSKHSAMLSLSPSPRDNPSDSLNSFCACS
jgi:hypothetical protein